ncbi:MAG TPA: nicotinamide-nucleotide amidohydrolase family protein [Candidatus Limnocylindria bacterium]|nr:nicotinamide-nucleotide amidohydrolase family protein [Candidatus Limnocylindria bacterium]
MSGGPSEAELSEAARRLGEALRAEGWHVATAESSTGGLIGHSITTIPGSSDYYPGGVISYSNRAKEVELSVPASMLEEHGAVSAEVAMAMAEGARNRFGTELGIAVTGVAGPEGGSEAKPVGTHWIGVALRGHPSRAEHRLYAHDRDGNRAAAALDALELGLAEVMAASPIH